MTHIDTVPDFDPLRAQTRKALGQANLRLQVKDGFFIFAPNNPQIEIN